MEVTKRKREEQGWQCRNGLTPPRSDHFLLRQTDRNHRKSLLPVRGYPGFIQRLFQSGSYHPASRGKSSAVSRRRESIPQRQPRRQRPALPIGSALASLRIEQLQQCQRLKRDWQIVLEDLQN